MTDSITWFVGSKKEISHNFGLGCSFLITWNDLKVEHNIRTHMANPESFPLERNLTGFQIYLNQVWKHTSWCGTKEDRNVRIGLWRMYSVRDKMGWINTYIKSNMYVWLTTSQWSVSYQNPVKTTTKNSVFRNMLMVREKKHTAHKPSPHSAWPVQKRNPPTNNYSDEISPRLRRLWFRSLPDLPFCACDVEQCALVVSAVGRSEGRGIGFYLENTPHAGMWRNLARLWSKWLC